MNKAKRIWNFERGYLQSRNGITLIELVMIIVIVVVLMVQILPALQSDQEMVSKDICMDNLRQIGKAISMYASDYDGYLPGGHDNEYKNDWQTMLSPYVGISSDLPDWGPPANMRFFANRACGNLLVCPEAVDEGRGTAFYGCNHGSVFRDPNQTERTKLNSLSPTVFLITDSCGQPIVYSPTIWKFTVDLDEDGLSDCAAPFAKGDGYNSARPKRHNGGANYLFVDGSVKWVSMKDWESNKDGMWGPGLP